MFAWNGLKKLEEDWLGFEFSVIGSYEERG
jgi:hypothetical protein